tara:strand:- start:337 stop:657 length:321 start_codon:yes stop_codon:yes gene_type:complete
MQEKIKLNPNETIYIDPEGVLIIDGCSSDGCYDWTFALGKNNFLALLENLSHHPLHPEYEPITPLPEGTEPSEIIIEAIKKMRKDAGDLNALCNRNKIPHLFQTWR